MGKKVDPRDFLLNTDHEMDKIIYFKQDKLTPNAYGSVTIPHNLGFAPLIMGVWSRTEDFANPQKFHLGLYLDPNTNTPVIDSIRCTVTENDILLEQYAVQGNFDYYVRLIGFEPSDSHRKLGKTSQNARQFILNTDYNYLKLYKSGVENIVVDPTYTGTELITIQHNLGYRPQALFWVENSSQGNYSVSAFDLVKLPSTTTFEGSSQTSQKEMIESYPDRFVIRPPLPQFGDTHKLHYRIYYDEAIWFYFKFWLLNHCAS